MLHRYRIVPNPSGRGKTVTRRKTYKDKEDSPKMATSEMCVDDLIREDNMSNVAIGESCHLLATCISEQVKETVSLCHPCSFEHARPTNLGRGHFLKVTPY